MTALRKYFEKLFKEHYSEYLKSDTAEDIEYNIGVLMGILLCADGLSVFDKELSKHLIDRVYSKREMLYEKIKILEDKKNG